MLRVATAAVLLALALATPALADGTLTPVDARIVAGTQVVAGPSFAGDGIAWGTPVDFRGSYDLDVLRDATRTTQHVPGPGPYQVLNESFAASSDVVAFSLDAEVCDPSNCRGGGFTSLGPMVFAGPIGEPLDFQTCGSGGPFGPSVDAEATVIAYVSACSGGAVVRDLAAPNDTPWRVFPSYGPVRVAGRYLAALSGASIVVYDWHTGDVVYKVEEPLTKFDVNAEGVVAVTTPSEVYWASPQEPSPHRIAELATPADVRIAGSRVAVRSGDRLRVLDLDGPEVASTSASDTVGDIDFDGSRLVFAAQPCEESAIVTWDLQGDPPSMPPGLCPGARLAGKVGVVNLQRRTLTVTVRCPSTPALGCTGWWDVKAPRGSMQSLFALAPGERRNVRLKLSPGRACAFARHRVREAEIYLGADFTRREPEAGSGTRQKIKRFQVVGRVAAACPRASAPDRSP